MTRPEFGNLADMAIVADPTLRDLKGFVQRRNGLTERLRTEKDPNRHAATVVVLRNLRNAVGFGEAAARASITDPRYGAPRMSEEDIYPTPPGFTPIDDEVVDLVVDEDAELGDDVQL
ncbi:MAG: hypothetical protein WBA46_14360 [Thermomicrobiales bacterium]